MFIVSVPLFFFSQLNFGCLCIFVSSLPILVCIREQFVEIKESIAFVFVSVLYLMNVCLQVNVSESAGISQEQKRVVAQKCPEQWLGHNHDEDFNKS